VTDSQDVTISHIHINSPKKSHNTDGIDLSRTIGVNIHDIQIESGKVMHLSYLFVKFMQTRQV